MATCAPRKAANLFQREAGEDHTDLYGGIAALGLANDQLFVSAATQRSPNFSNQTTTFLEKKTDLHVPPRVIFQVGRKRRERSLLAHVFGGNFV